MKALTDKYECQFFSRLVKDYVGSYDIDQSIKYLQNVPIAWTSQTMEEYQYQFSQVVNILHQMF